MGVDNTFSLGISPSDHLMARAFLDETLGGSAKKWNEASVRQEAKDFVDQRRTFSMPSAGKEFAISFLAKHWLGLQDVTKEFDPAKFVKDYQTNREQLSLLPDWALKCPILSCKVKKIRVQNEEFIDLISNAIERTYPEEVKGKNLRVLALVSLDALTFAGGLSCGETVAHVLGALWNKLGDLADSNFKLTRDNVDEVIFETCRLFPAVSNIAYERREAFGNGEGSQFVGREILAIGPLLQDPTLWGDDAKEFRLRGGAAYSSEAFCPFAELAPNRRCPGKDLAIALIRELVLEIDSHHWKVPGTIPCHGKASKVTFLGYGCLDFTVHKL